MKKKFSVVITFLFVNICIYLLGSLIANDFNPNNWYMVQTVLGTTTILFLEGAIFFFLLLYYDY